MSTTVNLDELKRRYRGFVMWKRVRKAAAITAVASGVLVVLLGAAVVFAALTNNALYEELRVTNVFSPGLGFMTLGGVLLMNTATRKAKELEDKSFTATDHAFLVKHLPKLGVKDPVSYLALHPVNVEAFRRVKDAARFNIEAPPEHKGNREDDSDIELYKAKQQEELMVASLVFPGENELHREQRILALINERGYTKYADIKAMCDHIEDHPKALGDGAL